MNRRKSREVLMKLMFEQSINKEPIEVLIQNYKEANHEDTDDLDMNFINNEAEGVLENIKNIDFKIEENMKKWKLDRISKVDLTIMRIAAYEIMNVDEIPAKVSINEAVELSKLYSTDNSPAFINGVLDSIKKNL
ncbi:transcription antitermination factor NusB [Clostridium sp. DL1XJH146]